jgi:hypothetical protein
MKVFNFTPTAVLLIYIGLNADLDQYQKLKKFTVEICFLCFFYQNCNILYLSLGPYIGLPRYRRSLQLGWSRKCLFLLNS